MEPITQQVTITFAPIAMQMPKVIKGVGSISVVQEVLRLYSDRSERNLIAAFSAGVWLYAELSAEKSNG